MLHDPQDVAAFRASEVYEASMRKWKIQVYFSVRFNDISGKKYALLCTCASARGNTGEVIYYALRCGCPICRTFFYSIDFLLMAPPCSIPCPRLEGRSALYLAASLPCMPHMLPDAAMLLQPTYCRLRCSNCHGLCDHATFCSTLGGDMLRMQRVIVN